MIGRACSTCHDVERVNDARNSADRWRVIAVDYPQYSLATVKRAKDYIRDNP